MRVRRILFLVAFVCFFGSSGVWAQGSLLNTLTEFRLQYSPPLSPQQLGELLTRTALSEPGWGLLRKPAGNRCPSPMGVDVACDYLVWMPTGQGFDVLIDAEGSATPTWVEGDVFPADRVIAPWRPNLPEPEPSEPPEVADDPSHDLILDALATLEQRQTELHALIEREAAALRQEHADANAHHETDDEAPGKSSKWEVILGLLAAALAGLGVAQ